MRTPSLPLDPVAIKDARDIISNADKAASVSPSLRRLAFMVAANGFGVRVRQCQTPQNSRGNR